MADRAGPAVRAGAGAPGQQPQEQPPWWQGVVRSLLMYFVFQQAVTQFMNYRKGEGFFAGPGGANVTQAANAVSSSVPGTTAVPGANGTNATVAPVINVVNVWPRGTLVDVRVQLSTAENGEVDFGDSSLPHVTWEGIDYAAKKWERTWDTEWKVPAGVQNNGSLWADIFMTRAGDSPQSSDKRQVLHTRARLTRFMPQRKIKEKRRLMSNLLGANATAKAQEEKEEKEEKETAEERAARPIISYYHPNLTLAISDPGGPVPYMSMPEQLREHMKLAEPLPDAGVGKLFPVLYPVDFWLLNTHMNPINETTPVLPLRVSLSSSAWWKFQLLVPLHESFEAQSAANGGGGELDEVKRIFLETSIWLLLLTAVVSGLHMLFEFLAFTSDISHWKSKKELVGVSVRTIITNVVVQVIIMLYLLDNNENTSYMILGGQGIGLLIEAWKITKAVDVAVIPATTGLLPYKLKITDKHVLSEEELKTQEYDKLAFKYVTWGTTPFLVGYTIYSLFYSEHKSAYSFVISTLTSFTYAFGFVQLIPQLIINYKLKSVAHIPMKAMAFKTLNTVIDDVFSFVIKMPLLHRLACFRDDVVFAVLLWQMWKYRVDPTRANEYGQMLTDEEKEKLAKAGKLLEVAEKEKADAADAVKAAKKDAKKETKKNR